MEKASLGKVSRVAGTWSHAAVKDTLRITIEPFQRLRSDMLSEVRRRGDPLAEALGLAKVEVKTAPVA